MINKEHKEFFAVDLSSGWTSVPGYPPGVDQKILSGHLDFKNKRGGQSRLLRFLPGAATTEPVIHDYWEEVYIVSGELKVGNQTFGPNTYAARPPQVPHGPFSSDTGCMLFEVHTYE